MADLLSLLLFIIFIVLGYLFPKPLGWSGLILALALGPTALTFAGSSFLPLTAYRICYAVTFGIVIKAVSYGFPLKSILNIVFVKILIIFTTIVFLFSVNYDPRYYIFSFVPNNALIVLPFLLIKDRETFIRLLNIYIWISAFLGVSAILELFYDINLANIIASNIPGVIDGTKGNYVQSRTGFLMERTGFYRPGGIYGSSVHTGYAAAFLLPLTLWYIIVNKKRGILAIISYIPLIISVIGIIILQTRATYVTVITMFIFLLFFNLLEGKINRKILHNIFIKVFAAILVLIVAFPDSFQLIKSGFKYLYFESFYGGAESVEGKIDRIPQAFNLFLQSPIWGYLCSPGYAYSELMYGADLPAPVLYMLSGGIIVLISYLLLLFKMPLDIFILFNKIKKNSIDKITLLLITCSMLSGVFVLFASHIEIHLTMMIILYISVYKAYFFDKIQIDN